MNQKVLNLSGLFDSLIDTVKEFDIAEHRKLMWVLEKKIAAAEAALEDNAPETVQAILEAQAAYEAGDLITLDDYMAKLDTNV